MPQLIHLLIGRPVNHFFQSCMAAGAGAGDGRAPAKRAFVLTEYEGLDEVIKKYRIEYEPTPDFIDKVRRRGCTCTAVRRCRSRCRCCYCDEAGVTAACGRIDYRRRCWLVVLQFFIQIFPERLFLEGRTDASRGVWAQRRAEKRLAARAFDYFYTRFEGVRNLSAVAV
jgi:hypothetical protein